MMFHDIRTVNSGGRVWLALKDLALALGRDPDGLWADAQTQLHRGELRTIEISRSASLRVVSPGALAEICSWPPVGEEV